MYKEIIMYKEILDALLDGLDDPTGVKTPIIENQLRYHFANKTKETEDLQNDSAIIVRRVLDKLYISELIGVQPITPDNHEITSCGIEYEALPESRPLQCRWTIDAIEDIKNINGIDLHCEMIHAIAVEVENKITQEIVNKIDQVASYSGSKNIIFESFEDMEDITKCIIKEVKEVDGNWIIITPTILAMLQSSKDATYKQTDGVRLGFSAGSITNAGVIDENIKVYVNTYGDERTVLIGSKVENREDTPIVYAPETMLMPVKMDANSEEVFGTVWNFMTRSALFVEPVAADAIYRKLVIRM